MSFTDFDDLEDPAFAGGAPRPERADQVKAAVERAAALLNFERCPRCSGTGSRFRGPCFACKGAGKVKAGFSTRSAAATKAKATREQNERIAGQKARDAFAAAYPAEWKWIIEARERFNDFAESLFAKITQYGSLTDGQLAAVQRGLAKAAERKVPVAIDVAGLDAAFAVAREKGAKIAVIRTKEVTFSLAKASGKNPGAIYAKRADGEYLGKIIGGAFTKAFACTPADAERIVEASRDPKAAALRYAAETGACSICGAELTDPKSIEAGIGPVCAGKFGWG